MTSSFGSGFASPKVRSFPDSSGDWRNRAVRFLEPASAILANLVGARAPRAARELVARLAELLVDAERLAFVARVDARLRLVGARGRRCEGERRASGGDEE